MFRLGGPTIHPSMLWPLLVMALGFTLLFLALHLAAMRTEILRRRVRRCGCIAGAPRRATGRADVDVPHLFVAAAYASLSAIGCGLVAWVVPTTRPAARTRARSRRAASGAAPAGGRAQQMT